MSIRYNSGITRFHKAYGKSLKEKGRTSGKQVQPFLVIVYCLTN